MSAPDAPPRSAPARRFQFGLIDLAEVIAGIGIALALVVEFDLLGVGIAFVALLVLGSLLSAAHLRPVLHARTEVLPWLVFGTVSLACCGGIFASRSAARQSSCGGHLAQIGLALVNYHDRYGQFPPPYVADSAGRPMHSWRVLILPFMDYGGTYAAYDLNEPWNGPKNRLLAAKAPRHFACPSAADGPPDATHYFYVTGPRRPGHQGHGLRPDEITDGHRETILVVESHSLSANWLEPRDLTLEEALSGINSQPGPCIGSPHTHEGRPGRRVGGANVLMVDDSVRYLPENLSRESLAALLTIDGGDEVDFDDLRPLPPDYALLWLPLVTVVYVVAVAWRHWKSS